MKLFAIAVSLLCLVLVNVDQGFGQAIIGYGINVGRAGAAGAGAGAAGAGAAGIFRKLGDRMAGDDSKASGNRTARTAQPEFDPKDLENAKAERELPAYSTSGTVKTESGVRISGLSSRRASPTRVRYAARPYDYAPAGSGATATTVPSESAAVASQPEPAVASTQNVAATPAAPAATSQAEVSTPPQAQAAGPSVLDARQSGSTPTATDAALTPDVRRFLEVDSEIADIAMGTPIEDLIARFGKPLFKMVGLGGQGYSEKYIFRAPDGRRFTVFAQDGAVADITIEPADLLAR